MDNERHANEFDGVMKRLIGDDRPPLLHLRWAPGNYSNRCCECGEMFIGDKRAGMCADCAYDIEENGRRRRIQIGTIGHVDSGRTTLAAMMALLAGTETGLGNPLFDMGLERFAPEPAPRRQKTEHDHARIARAEEKRQRRNAKRLRELRQ